MKTARTITSRSRYPILAGGFDAIACVHEKIVHLARFIAWSRMKFLYSKTCCRYFFILAAMAAATKSFAICPSEMQRDEPASRFSAIVAESQPAEGKFDIKDASFLLPQDLAKGRYYSAVYLYNVVIPRDWTLDIIKAPMFCYAGKYTMQRGFNLQGSLATLFVSTRINLGPFWNYSLNNVHFGIGYQFVFNYGLLKQFGYNTTLTGWEQQPSAAIGYSFQTMAVTLRSDLYWTHALYVSEGGNVIPYSNNFLNGYSISLSLEQRLWANRVMSFGIKWNYLRYHILAWPAFPVNRYKYDVPEFQLGLNF